MINYLANPHRFLKFARIAAPIFAIIALIAFILGLWQALIVSPADYQQGDSVRIMYVHVPAAWTALMAYTALTLASFVSFVWRHPLADIGARAFAIPGLAFTFLCLVTGSLWGKPTWGTWWEWDGRMTSVLFLFFIYLAYLSIATVIEDKNKATRFAAILAMVGFINIPIIKFSVEWWNSLHQRATLSNLGAPGLPVEMLTPLGLMTLAYSALFAWLSIRFTQKGILQEMTARTRSVPKAIFTLDNL